MSGTTPQHSFEEYAKAVTNILKLVSVVNTITEIIGSNTISQTLGTTFTPVQPQQIANQLGFRASKLPSVVSEPQQNLTQLISEARNLAMQIEPSLVKMSQAYGVRPSVLQTISTYVKVAQVLPQIIAQNKVTVVGQTQYSQNVPVLTYSL